MEAVQATAPRRKMSGLTFRVPKDRSLISATAVSLPFEIGWMESGFKTDEERKHQYEGMTERSLQPPAKTGQRFKCLDLNRRTGDPPPPSALSPLAPGR